MQPKATCSHNNRRQLCYQCPPGHQGGTEQPSHSPGSQPARRPRTPHTHEQPKAIQNKLACQMQQAPKLAACPIRHAYGPSPLNTSMAVLSGGMAAIRLQLGPAFAGRLICLTWFPPASRLQILSGNFRVFAQCWLCVCSRLQHGLQGKRLAQALYATA